MRRYFYLSLLFIAVLIASSASACTSVVVGKNASANGAFIFARTEDHVCSHAKRLVVFPAGTYAKGELFTDPRTGMAYRFTHDSYKFVADPDMPCVNGLPPDAPEMFEAFGSNERGLAVSATNTTFLGPQAQICGNNYVVKGVNEGVVTKILLAEAATAIEGVELLGRIVESAGVGDECGFIIFLADNREMWMFETLGRYRWVASKVPDDKFLIVANDMVTDYVDLNDRANFRGTPDIKEFAIKNGFAVYGGAEAGAHSGDVNLAASYGDNNTPYNAGRRWRGYSMFAPSANVLLYDKEKQGNVPYPMYIAPDKRISAADIMEFQRDRYEGTQYDLSNAPRVTELNDDGYDQKETLVWDGAKDAGSGSDADKTQTLRPVGINTQKETHIVEVMPGYPPEICARLWLVMGQSEHSVNLPFYGLIVDTPKADKVILTEDRYSPDSSWWQFMITAYYSRFDREKYGRAVRAYWREYELALLAEQSGVEKEMLALYKKSPDIAKIYITAYVSDMREKAANRAKEIYEALQKHIDTKPGEVFKVPE